MRGPQSIYIHIPFCSHKCDFCDFAAFSGLESRQEEYLERLLKEIDDTFQNRQHNSEIKTVFYGGGTPGLSPLGHMRAIQEKIKSHLTLAEDVEVTMETTPHAISKEKAEGWLEIGINRLSVGIESLSDFELKAMGRDHSRQEAYAGIEAAQQAGYQNICLDLMYGLPEQTLASFQKTLDEIVDLSRSYNIKHVSAYGLEIAINSPLLVRYPRESTSYAGEDEFVAMYETLVATLSGAGFSQYEVSNFAKSGYQSRHNITYWENNPYYAFGVGAHRYVDGVRSANSKSFNKYMRGEDGTAESVDAAGQVMEAVMLALRMVRGLDLKDFEERYGVNLLKTREKELALLTGEGLLALSDGRLSIPSRAMPVMNSIISRLI